MSKLQTVAFDASEAKNSFGKLIDAAQHSPVAINRRGRRVAFVISPRDMDTIEDFYLGMRTMEIMRKSTSLGVKASEAYLRKILHAKD
ncbi:type II toxin-antitoxin system Phd/YefM family antitoxin [Candidatus Kaiserbacteria bacterium]|nr:type II toxin-antitoxin system Phd/YefM family antitoxin [Candidatus Kaiserbacteria bacterium]